MQVQRAKGAAAQTGSTGTVPAASEGKREKQRERGTRKDKARDAQMQRGQREHATHKEMKNKWH